MKTILVNLFVIAGVFGGAMALAGPQDVVSEPILKFAYTRHAQPNGTISYEFDGEKVIRQALHEPEALKAFTQSLSATVNTIGDQMALAKIAIFEIKHGGPFSSLALEKVFNVLADSPLKEEVQKNLVENGIDYWIQSSLVVNILEKQKVIYPDVKELAWSRLRKPHSNEFSERPDAKRLAKILAFGGDDSDHVVGRLAVLTHHAPSNVAPEEAAALDGVESHGRTSDEGWRRRVQEEAGNFVREGSRRAIETAK